MKYQLRNVYASTIKELERLPICLKAISTLMIEETAQGGMYMYTATAMKQEAAAIAMLVTVLEESSNSFDPSRCWTTNCLIRS